MFYSKLNDEHVFFKTEEENAHAQRVWKEFRCKSWEVTL